MLGVGTFPFFLGNAALGWTRGAYTAEFTDVVDNDKIIIIIIIIII